MGSRAKLSECEVCDANECALTQGAADKHKLVAWNDCYCISLFLYDRQNQRGALVHFANPWRPKDCAKTDQTIRSVKYMLTGKSDIPLEAYIVGGKSDDDCFYKEGENNSRMLLDKVKQSLISLGIPITYEETFNQRPPFKDYHNVREYGEDEPTPYLVCFDTRTGEIFNGTGAEYNRLWDEMGVTLSSGWEKVPMIPKRETLKKVGDVRIIANHVPQQQGLVATGMGKLASYFRQSRPPSSLPE